MPLPFSRMCDEEKASEDKHVCDAASERQVGGQNAYAGGRGHDARFKYGNHPVFRVEALSGRTGRYQNENNPALNVELTCQRPLMCFHLKVLPSTEYLRLLPG